MSAALRVAVVQSNPGADVAANLDLAARLVARAAALGAKLAVLPEYSHYFTSRLTRDWADIAEPLDGPVVRGLAAIAVQHGIHLVAGVLESAESDRFSNTLVALDPAGEVVAVHRKQHLYDAFGQRESDAVVPGPIEPVAVFEAGGVRVGLQTCYDIRFPEVSRRLVDAGAQLLVVPAEWVPGDLKEHHWRTLLTARAIENTAYVAAADHAPPAGIGVSLIVDPAGIELAALIDEVDVATADISLDRVAEVRRTNPALALRRFHVVPGAPPALAG